MVAISTKVEPTIENECLLVLFVVCFCLYVCLTKFNWLLLVDLNTNLVFFYSISYDPAITSGKNFDGQRSYQEPLCFDIYFADIIKIF